LTRERPLANENDVNRSHFRHARCYTEAAGEVTTGRLEGTRDRAFAVRTSPSICTAWRAEG